MGAGNCSASTYCKDEMREKKVFKNLKRFQSMEVLLLHSSHYHLKYLL
jgi:hypothetical protein